MLKIESNSGAVKMEMKGTILDVAAEFTYAAHAFFGNITRIKGEDMVRSLYVAFLEAFNEGAPLDWDEIVKSVD